MNIVKKQKNIKQNLYDTVKKMSVIIMVIVLSFTGISVGDMEIIGEKVMAASTPKYGTSGKWAYHILEDSKNKKTVEIASKSLAKKFDKKLTIPSTLKINKSTYTVTKIADYAFLDCYCDDCLKKENTTLAKVFGKEYDCNEDHYETLDEVIIPSTIETIGEYSFWDVNKVTFKSNSKLKTIGESAFYVTSIKKITIPASVEKIEVDAFADCEELSSVTFEKGSKLKTIGDNAFAYSKITKITIPKSVTKIGSYAFGDCELSTITFETEKTIKFKDDTFDDNPIEKVYVQNYDVFNIVRRMLINMEPVEFYDDDYNEDYDGYGSVKPIYFYSAKTRLVVDGEDIGDIDVGKNYKKTINLNQYLEENHKGVHLTNIECRSFTHLEYDRGGWGWSSQYVYDSLIGKNSIVSYGYPYMEINSDYEINKYNIQSTGFEVMRDRSPNSKKDNVFTYTVNYFDKFRLNPYPTDEKMQKVGYYIDGYRFKGNDCDSVVKEMEMASKLTAIHESTVVASLVYKPIKYNIVYDCNHFEVNDLDVEDEKCEYDKKIKITTQIPGRKGYKFVGWSINKSGKGEIYKPGQEVINLTTKNGEKVTLYAIWEKSLINIYFDANGGVVSPTSIKVEYQNFIGKKLPVPEREGYNFVGWTMGENGGTKVDEYFYINLAQDFKVYAQWEEQEYEITFDANGGETNVSKKKLLYEESIGVLPKPTRTGYKFEGWYTEKDGGNKISSSTIVQKNATYYAHWIQKTKQIKVKIQPPNGNKAAGYQIRYSKNGEEVFNEIKPAALMNYITITINGAKDGDVYEIKARYYVMKKGKKKWSKETVKIVKLTTKTSN